MPVLDNKQWERLAQGLADGMHPKDAYVAAGYSKSTARTAVNGMLKRNTLILDRKDEILNDRREAYSRVNPALIPVATHAALATLQITKERILSELWDNAMKAKQAVPVLDKKGNPTGMFTANFTASNQALQLIGKEFDMFTDRKRDEAPTEKVVYDVEKMDTDALLNLERALDNVEQLVAPNAG